jgi:hypothetical protein
MKYLHSKMLLAIGLFSLPALGLDTPTTGSAPANPMLLSPVTHTLRLEDEKVWVNIYQRPGTNIQFVNVHDNENTSAEAAKSYILSHGGRLVELEHGRGRTIVIRRNGVLHRFDPNRMFSEAGLRRSLKYHRNLTDENFALATGFASDVVDFIEIEPGKPIIAVHNNTDGKLTINDFKPGEWYGDDTREIFVNPAEDPDNFFYTNSPVLFKALKAMRYNVALMVDNPPDRGTLANLVNARNGVYVLVEAEHDQLRRQIVMLEDLGRLLVEAYPATN